MANIPVERTSSGTPWWLWLLGLLLLLALIWFLISAFSDDEEEIVEDEIETVEPIPAAPVETASLDLSNLYVTRVTGDRTFFVAPSEGSSDETLVILDQNPSPDVAGIEGQVDVNPGQNVDLSDGRLEPLGDENLANMGIPDDELNMMTSDTEVIRIDGGEVEISNADLENVEVQ